MIIVKNYAAPLLGPILLLLVALGLIGTNVTLPHAAQVVLPLAPYILGGGVLVVALWFRRVRPTPTGP